MKNQLNHSLYSSFSLFLDHSIVSLGEAFQTGTFALKKASASLFPDLGNTFESSAGQFIYDESIQGAIIPSGAYFDGDFIDRSAGVAIDFDYANIYYTGQVSQGYVVASRKEYSIYYGAGSEEEVLFNSKLVNEYVGEPSSYVIPAIFIQSQSQDQQPWAFGGEDNRKDFIRTILVSDSQYLLDGAMSICVGLTRKIFPVFSPEDLPIGPYGDLKLPPSGYNYTAKCHHYINNVSTRHFAYIEDVRISPMPGEVNRAIGNNMRAAFADFHLSTIIYR